MDTGYQQAMEALGRPQRESVAPPTAPRRPRVRLEAANDVPMLLLALTVGAANGYAVGDGMVGFSLPIMALPLVVAVAGALKLGRPLVASVVAGLAGVLLSAAFAGFFTVARFLDGFW